MLSSCSFRCASFISATEIISSQPIRRKSSRPSDMLPRRFRTRALLSITLIGIGVLIICSYTPISSPIFLRNQVAEHSSSSHTSFGWWHRWWPAAENDKCEDGTPKSSSKRLDTGDMYPKLDFSLPDNGGTGFWSEILESRYREIKQTWKDRPLEVILISFYFD
ncbi:uncharacterized protein TNCV_3027811 [Trichonephila clavipes]|nr:uncharacterized protein TNCV_3027811 [Trichonephila clavipes]